MITWLSSRTCEPRGVQQPLKARTLVEYFEPAERGAAQILTASGGVACSHKRANGGWEASCSLSSSGSSTRPVRAAR
jgi:hypothetical protein